MKTRSLAALAAIFTLSACQQAPTTGNGSLSGSSENDSQRVVLVRAQQYQLWSQDIINTHSPLPADTIYANSTRVSLDWDGDAAELLEQLARQRGLKFSHSGVRLPLPLNIHVRDTTFQNLLRIIESQTQWRAALKQYPGQLHLDFMPVTNGKTGKGRP